MRYLLLLLLLIPAVTALDLTAGTQVILGAGERQTLADDFSGEVVTTADVNTNQNLLVIGGPCANPLWEQYADMSCGEWPYASGEGIILTLDSGRVILVAGTTQADTELLLSQLLEQPLDTQTVSETSSDQFTITEDESSTITVNGERLVISNLAISGSIVSSITVDGERFTNLGQGRSIVTDDDMLVRILSVSQDSITITVTDFSEDDDQDEDEVTVEEGDSDRVTINGERIDIEDLSIDDDTLDVTVDGDEFSNLEEGDRRTVGDVEFEVEEINDDEATFSFEESDDNADGLDEGDEFTLREGDDETVEVDGDDIEFTNITIGNSTLSVTVEGTSHSGLTAGSTINTGDITFQVENVEESEAELSVDEIE